jgi:hypothetical protein
MWILSLLFGWIPKLIVGIWDWVTDSLENFLLLLLVLSLALAFTYRHAAKNLEAKLNKIELAQKKARKDQIAANKVPVTKSIAIAENSNAKAPAYYNSVSDAARSASVRPQKVQPCPASVPGANTPIQSVHGPDPTPSLVPTPDLICRPKSDDDKLIYASGRAAQMHQETLDLIDQGVVLPMED